MALLDPDRDLILSYFSRITLSLDISHQHDSTNIVRTLFLPTPVIRPIRILSELEYCDGVIPT